MAEKTPDFDAMTLAQLRSLGKAAHLVVQAFDSGRKADLRGDLTTARIDNFKRRVEELRKGLYG